MQIKNRRMYEGPGIYCGRPSPLGNPFREGRDGTREDVIAKHKAWLWSQISKPGVIGNYRIMKALAEIEEDSILICWCYPKPCHISTIIKAWRWLKKEGLI